MTLERRTPLRRGRGLARQSPKRRAERSEREALCEEAIRLAGGRCTMAALIPEVKCWHPAGIRLDVDEIKGRGVNPGGHLDPNNVQVACRAHHNWKTTHPKEARERGLRLESWETRDVG